MWIKTKNKNKQTIVIAEKKIIIMIIRSRGMKEKPAGGGDWWEMRVPQLINRLFIYSWSIKSESKS